MCGRLAWLLVLLLAVGFFPESFGLQRHDRVIGSSASQHAHSRSSWVDMPVNSMPRFGIPESLIFHANVPKLRKNDTIIRLNPSSDLKVSLAFDNHKHVVSWITVFDSVKKRSLRKLSVIFTKDEYEIISVAYELEYNPKIARLDPSHPSLRGFELEYRWKEAPVEDPLFGLQVLCGTCLIGFMLIFIVVILNAEEDLDPAQIQKKHEQQKKRKAQTVGVGKATQ